MLVKQVDLHFEQRFFGYYTTPSTYCPDSARPPSNHEGQVRAINHTWTVRLRPSKDRHSSMKKRKEQQSEDPKECLQTRGRIPDPQRVYESMQEYSPLQNIQSLERLTIKTKPDDSNDCEQLLPA